MTAVLHSPSHLASTQSPPLSCSSNDGTATLLSNDSSIESDGDEGFAVERKRERREEEQLSLLTLLIAVVRKSLAGCRTEGDEDLRSMEIGWPTNVRHVAHVTFDRFHGFLGLPVEFEPEVPRRSPSASASVFGVSIESMQCSYDTRKNSVPTILLLLQRRLYEHGGLQAEGIFRINAENSQEEYVRDQLNSGLVPDGIDVHCLASLIKAWFRELPTGVLDPLNPEQVMECQSEEEYDRLVKLLPPPEAALLDWALNLMADVVQEEHHNKMNAHNVAMVFAPNMTQMADPLTALMYAVQVMNFLKTLILKTLKKRQEPDTEGLAIPRSDSSDENGRYSPQLHVQACDEEASEQLFLSQEPALDSKEVTAAKDDEADDSRTCDETFTEDNTGLPTEENVCEIPAHGEGSSNGSESIVDGASSIQVSSRRARRGRSSAIYHKKGARKAHGSSAARASTPAEKSKGSSIMSRINSKVERAEAWR